MNFIKWEFAPGLIIAFVALILVIVFSERRFFKMVKTYWFYGRSFFSYLASFLFMIGMGLLFISLLDARGPEEKIRTEAPVQRTIILIDTSASMLAEDVKPSRLQKAVLVAKHFARKAAGQQIAVVVFAEIQKKIVPFTNDLDLIDARLDTIKNLKNNYGSSALSVAIQESIQYFRDTGSEAVGNILVLTDGEETADGIKLNVPKDVHVALVGVGSEQGGRIPLDDGRGLRYGYKKNGGKDVVTKLNERFFERTAADLPSAKYWIANSYTLPSDEIVEFFKGEIIKGENQQDMVIRPVMVEWIVFPALALIFASYFFKAMKIFTLGLLLVISPLGWSQEDAQPEDKGPKLSEATLEKLDKLQQGQLTRMQKIKLADDLHRDGAIDEAIQIYSENLPVDKIDPSVPPEAYLNLGTGLLQKKQTGAGLKIYDKLSKSLKDDEGSKKIKDLMAKNTLSHFKQAEEQKKKEEQEKKDQKNQDKDNKQDPNKQDQGGKSKDDKQQNNSSGQQGEKDQKSGQKPDDKKDQQGKGNEKDPKQEKDEKDKEQKDKEKKEGEKDEDGKDGDEKKDKDGNPEESQPKNLPPKKMPAKLKQLMSDDRQLQMKVIENGTRDLNKKRNRTSKDW